MDYIIPAFTMITLDSIYLSSIGGPIFRPMIKKIQKEELKLNIQGAIACYILLMVVLYKYIIHQQSLSESGLFVTPSHVILHLFAHFFF